MPSWSGRAVGAGRVRVFGVTTLFCVGNGSILWEPCTNNCAEVGQQIAHLRFDFKMNYIFFDSGNLHSLGALGYLCRTGMLSALLK